MGGRCIQHHSGAVIPLDSRALQPLLAPYRPRCADAAGSGQGRDLYNCGDRLCDHRLDHHFRHSGSPVRDGNDDVAALRAALSDVESGARGRLLPQPR